MWRYSSALSSEILNISADWLRPHEPLAPVAANTSMLAEGTHAGTPDCSQDGCPPEWLRRISGALPVGTPPNCCPCPFMFMNTGPAEPAYGVDILWLASPPTTDGSPHVLCAGCI